MIFRYFYPTTCILPVKTLSKKEIDDMSLLQKNNAAVTL